MTNSTEKRIFVKISQIMNTSLRAYLDAIRQFPKLVRLRRELSRTAVLNSLGILVNAQTTIAYRLIRVMLHPNGPFHGKGA